MTNKNNNDNNSGIDYSALSAGEYAGTGKLLISKYDFDLFDEAKAIPSKIIRVKRTGMDKTERWRVLQDEELLFVIEGNKLNKKERFFLRTLDGMNFLIAQFKTGCSSFLTLKENIKERLLIKAKKA